MDSVKLAEQTAQLAKENEELAFRLFLQEKYELQVNNWRKEVNDCLQGLTKYQAEQLTMSDFQPMPITKFVAAHLESKEMLAIYKSMEHIFPNAEKYAKELTFIIEHYAYSKKK